ncbi:MAG: Bax inhibitor-1/YccA family protein [Rickettsiales bacterium]
MNYNNPFDTTQYGQQSTAATYDAGLRAYMLKIYNYMASALVLTGLVAMFIAKISVVTNDAGQIMGLSEFGATMFGGPLKWVVMLLPLAFVLVLSFGINRLSVFATQSIFWAYSAAMGVSLSTIFLAYTGESIARVFFITAGTFGAMSIYGYTTKRDLTGMGSFLIMGLIGVIIASVVNIFLESRALHFAVSVIGLFIFIGLTAYDTQRLKNMYYQLAGNASMMAKASVMGALSLYLDFINIFMYLIQFMGDRR